MIINMASRAASRGQMNFGSLSVSKAQPPGALTTPLGSTGGESVSAPKDSLYGNFGKEMTRRLTEALKKNGVSQEAKTEASVLSQSLVGAMGEIEQQFGRDAATEVMAKILTGTAEGLGEDSLISSIQNALAGLKRLDPNGTGLKRLAESFNRDLALALDPEQLDEKLTKGETLSLSCALSKHFGTLAPLEDDNDDLSGSGQRTDLLESSVSPQAAKETFEMFGFDETGRWDLVKVVKDDNLSAEELKEAAEAGVTKAMELTMGTILENGSGLYLFQNLANFLEKDLQDKEAAAFVEKCIEDSFNLPPDKRGLSPKLAQMLSQV